MRQLLGFVTALLFGLSANAQTLGLTAGQPTTFSLPATGYTTAIYFDVPQGATRFRVELESDASAVDIDMFLRYGNRFSAQTAYGRPQSFDGLQQQAQYQSVGSTDEEFIAIGRSNYRPIRAGRWHLAVFNFASVAVDARIKVEFSNGAPTPVVFDVRFDLPGEGCDIAPWNDPAVVAPIGGNPGSTRGAQRKNAVLEAVRQLAAGLDSEAPISVRACWDDLPVDTDGRTTLAGASPTNFLIDDQSLVFSSGSTFPPAAFLPEKYAFYASAPAARLGGSSACRIRGGNCTDVTDMEITYNKRVGQSTVLGGAQYYFGYGPAPAGRLDFVAVSVHELGHGLGFASLVSLGSGSTPVGAKPLGRDDIFARQIIDISTGNELPFMRLTDAQRAAAMTSLSGLNWTDERAVNSPLNPPTGFPGVLMYAPNPIRSGSTLSHLTDTYFGQLMTPSINLSQGSRQLGLAVPMLYAVGWDPAPSTFPIAPAPFAGLWFERDRNGHGIDFQRIYTDAAGFDIYSLIFYTYDANGRPEWYIAVGPLVDGVFAAALDSAGNSLIRYRYVGGASPQQAVVTDSGKIHVDFNQARESPACNDGTARAANSLLGMMRWTLGGVSGAWCMEELIPASRRSTPDLTGTWYAGAADSGWGSSVAAAVRSGSQRFLFSTLYYPDANGAGRWAFVSSENYAAGQSLPVFERRGYCRTCPEAIVDSQIGTMTPSLTAPVQGQAGASRFGFDITYGGPEGGRFTRSNVPYEVLSVPQ